jgi:hypothetical protein
MTLRTPKFHWGHDFHLWNPLMTRDLARLIAGVWAFFWTWYGMASGIAEGHTIPGTLVNMAPGIAFTALTWIAFRHEMLGGAFLLLASFLMFVYFPLFAGAGSPSVIVASALLLGLPPLVAGLLFLIYHGREPS